MQLDDYYVGVNSYGPTQITLPADFNECAKYIIKAEMGPPLGNRKVTIVPQGSATIDGAPSYVIEQPYGYLSVQGRGNNWHIV